MGKTWLELMVANLVISRLALGAPSASANKGNSDPVACFPSGYIFSNRYNIPSQFMAWNMGQCNVGIMADPAMPVTKSQSCRFHF